MWCVVVLTAVCFGIAVIALGCGGEGVDQSSRGFRVEGTEAGDCEDNADNDADGLFDCDDPGCAGSSVCAPEVDGGTGGIGGNAGTGGIAGMAGMAGMGGEGGMAGMAGMAGMGGTAGMGGEGGMAGTGGMAGMGGGAGGTGGMPLMRVDAGLILLYAFDEGSGSTVADQSGVLPEHDLIVADPGNVTWSANHLTVNTATALSTAGAATKVATRAAASGELTVEAWIKPANTTQKGPSPIITMSQDPYYRNFMLGQEANTYAVRFRADGEMDWDNGSPTVFTTAGTATAALTHVVHTHRSDGAEVIYVDGVENLAFMRMGGTSMWDTTYRIIVANEATNDRTWLGELHLIAVYDRALDVGEVAQNFMAGP
jgi:hypothetical protein